MNVLMKRILWAVVLGVSVVSCFQGGRRTAAVEEAPVQNDTVYPLGFCTDSFSVVTGTISSGDNFIGWMTRLGISPQRAHSLSVASDSVFDVRKLRAGNTYQAYYKAVLPKEMYEKNIEKIYINTKLNLFQQQILLVVLYSF